MIYKGLITSNNLSSTYDSAKNPLDRRQDLYKGIVVIFPEMNGVLREKI